MEVKLLGYVINAQGIHTDPEKVQAINHMKTTRDQIWSKILSGNIFLFLPNYATVATPLVALTRKSNPLHVWSEVCQEAFDKLKAMLQSDRVLAYPRNDQTYKLYTDACDYAMGVVLVQEDDQGVERVVQITSPTNWTTNNDAGPR